MAAPNIDMIAASLRSCSIGGGAAPSAAASPFPARGWDPEGGVVGAAAAEAPLEGDITVELNSDVALPHDWEQCLNLKTGQIYYRNRSTGEKSMEDPRKFVYLSEEDEDGDEADDEDDGSESDEGDDSSEEEEDDAGDSDEFGNCSSAFSSSSSASSRDTIEWGGTGRGAPGVGADSVLVAAGCRVCMMYVMIPKKVERCPRCGGRVLHFSLGGDR